jgi:hypothetical protein
MGRMGSVTLDLVREGEGACGGQGGEEVVGADLNPIVDVQDGGGVLPYVGEAPVVGDGGEKGGRGREAGSVAYFVG